LVFLAGCSVGAPPDAASGDQDVTGAVKDETAERLLGAFGESDAVDHAMGGRAGVDVKTLMCLTSSNAALEESDPLFMVPITTCTFDDTNESPSHRSVTDAPLRAKVLFEALNDVAPGDAGMGKAYASAKTIACEGQGPGAGDDPANPPPTTVTCTITKDDGSTVSADGAKAKRLLQALGLLQPDAIDHAMGGRFGVDASDVQCVLSTNAALDPTAPLFEMPMASCSASFPDLDTPKVSLDDPEPKALVLLDALEKAGIAADSATGKTGVVVNAVTCRKAPGIATNCKIAR
jgi:hypothetical protein